MSKEKKPKKIVSEIVDTKEIAAKLKTMAEGITKDIDQQKDPTFTTQQRGKSNVEFNEDKKVLTLGDKITSRNFLNIGHAKKFMQTMMVTSKTYNYLNENKTASIREVYYELKHTLGKSKENTFEDQTESDACIVDLEHSVDTIREKLNLHANPKGTLYGDITLVDRKHNNDEFNAAKLGRGGWSIMSRVEPEEIEIKKVDAEYVLVIETEAMYERLVEEDFAKKNKAILISTGGQAARGTRRLIHRIAKEADLPVYMFSVEGNETIAIEENGLLKNVKIKELFDGKPSIKIKYPFENERAESTASSFTFDNTKVYKEPIFQIIRHPITEELFEIKSELGYSVKATKSHSIIVWDSGKKQFLEKKPGEINMKKDFLIVNLEIPNNESLKTVDLAEFALTEKVNITENWIINKNSKTKTPRFVEQNNLEEFCRLLGYYAAEGHCNDYQVFFSFNANETEYIEDVKKIAKNVFGLDTTQNNPHSSETQIAINNTIVAGIFRNMGKTGSTKKEIPSIVFNVPSNAKKAFLKGYFRGDGRVDFKESKSSAELWAKTVSKKLAYDLVMLTAQLGCPATIQHPKESSEAHEVDLVTNRGRKTYSIQSRNITYLVSIANKESLQGLEEIVADLNKGALKHIKNRFRKTGKIDSLPNEFVQQFRPMLRELFEGKLGKKLPPSTFQWPRISKEKLRGLTKDSDDERLSVLNNFLDQKITLTRIKEITEVKPEENFVYDIEMSSTHRFFANNICVHNTDGDPYGWYIYSVVKQGSMALAAHSDFLAVPDAKYIGMTLEDVEEFKLQNVTERMKEGDVKRAKEMLDYPWFQNKAWQDELKKAIQMKIRIEQQALANRSLSFVADEYLPKKIKSKDFLP